MTPQRLVVDAVCRYGVGPVSFTADAGEFVVLTGGWLSGKSAIVGVLAGFDNPDSGTVLLDGEDLHAMSRARVESRVGWFGAVIPAPGRAQRIVPPLVVGDDIEAPLEPDPAPNVIAALGARQRADRRLAPVVRTVRYLGKQGAVVVISSTHPVLLEAADRVVTLGPAPVEVRL